MGHGDHDHLKRYGLIRVTSVMAAVIGISASTASAQDARQVDLSAGYLNVMGTNARRQRSGQRAVDSTTVGGR